MSDTSMGPGWWLASDGRWYPPEQAPGSPTWASPGYSASVGGAPTMTAPAPQYAQSYQPPAGYTLNKKRRRWPWVVLALIVGMIIGAVLSASSQDDASTSTPTPTPGPADDAATSAEPVAPAEPAEPAEPAAPAAGPLTVGSTGNTSGFDVTLLQYVDQWQSTNQFESPSAGMRFVAVELDLVSTAAEIQTFSTLLGLEIIDSLGQRWPPGLYGIDLPGVGGDVAPGTNIRGWQVFEVPGDATGLRLTVKGSLTASGIEFQL